MNDLDALDGDVEELDARERCAIPGFVDRHTHACFAGDRVEEFALRAAGASYEQLHAAGGGILATVSATRGAGRRPARGRRPPSGLDGAPRHDDVRGQVRLRPRPRHRAGVAACNRGSRRCPDVPRRARRSPGVRAGRRVRRLADRRGAARGGDDRRGGRRLSRARRVRRCPGAAVPRGCPRPRAGVAAARRPVHRDQGAIPLAIELGARSVDHLEATGPDGVRTLAESDVAGVLLRRARCFSAARCLPAARSSMQVRRSRSPPTSTRAARSARACRSSARSPAQLGLSPAQALTACTVNAAHVLGRAESRGVSRRASMPTSSCSTRRTGATSRTTSEGTS